MNTPITFNCKITFDRHCRGARKTARINPPEDSHPAIKGRVPRVTRLMALAIRFEDLIQSGEIADYAELARLAHVTRARTKAGLAAARARGRMGGRPKTSPNDAKVRLAKTLLADKSLEVDDICETLKISRSTLYRYANL